MFPNSMMRILLLFFLCAAFLKIGTTTAQSVSLNLDSGFYQDSVIVEADFKSDSLSVYYTLDGSDPDTSDTPYSGSIILDRTRTVRLVAYTSEYQDTTLINRTYFINEATELPVLSLISDPDNLFSNDRGIYVEGTNGIPGYCRSSPKNWNQDWERPATLEFFEKNRNEGFTIDAGIKIGGGCTRLYDQKSLDIYFRGDYGASKLEYQVFKDKPITSFDRLALRSGGQDWYRAIIRNASTQSIVKDRMDLGYQAFKPVSVFINGEYWGIHMLREKQNEDFIESNYGYDENEIDMLTGNSRVKEGSADHYNAMIDFIKQNDISTSHNYAWVSDQMDIDQYIDYQIAQIYWANGDWPANNIIFWRPQAPDGKWKWLLYDVDMSMGSHSRGVYDTNIIKKLTTVTNNPYESPTWATLLFRSLLTNQDFRNKFIQRYSMHMHTTFQPSRMKSFIDSTSALIESEIPRHMVRWVKSLRLGSNMNWEKHLNVVENFIDLRPNYARSYLASYFNLVRLHSVQTKVEPANAGEVYIEGVRSDELEYGLIYQSVPAELKAKANPGYTFVGWSGDAGGSNETNELNITENSVLTAHFTRNEITESGVVINEINYRSADNFDPEDWIEFYNNSDETIDMSGWKFSDSVEETQFVFAEGTLLNADSYIVLTRDSLKFNEHFPDVNNRTGDIDFGFSGDGESLFLFDESDNMVDQLTYNDKSPWPIEADGLGATLSLTNPGFDNSVGENWAASSGYGTPGRMNNGVFVSNEEEIESELPSKITLNQNYPNPFNPETVIEFNLDKPTLVQLRVFDLQGRLVSVIASGMKSKGTHKAIWNASAYASGIYFYQLEAGDVILTRKLSLIK